WQLTTSSSPGNELLPVLRAALLRHSGGQVTVQSTDVRATRLADFDDQRLERVFGVDSFLPLTWYRTGLQRCRAVARIQTGHYDERVLHYRSPTEPGSSGSPVFDNKWRLIGLHHSGATRMPQLNNAGGTYAANEGITIDAIRARLATRPPEAPLLR